jgi:hypothetical protein
VGGERPNITDNHGGKVMSQHLGTGLASIIHRPVAVSRGASAKVPAWYGKIDLLEINTQYQEGHLESEV